MVDYTKLNLDTLNSNRASFTIAEQKEDGVFDRGEHNLLLLQEAERYWSALDDFRTRRIRARDYYRGKQWNDMIYNPETCSYVREEDYIKSQGKVPLKQNKIRPLVKNLLGQYRTDGTKAAVIAVKRVDATTSEMLTNTLQVGLDNNESKEKDARAFEEFLLSGSVVQKITFDYIPEEQVSDVIIDNTPISHMFFNSNIKDVKKDIRFIGQFHDMYIREIISTFAGNSKKKAAAIKNIYGYVLDPDIVGGTASPALGSWFIDNLDFYTSVESDKGRVFEIWYERHEWRLRCHDMQKGKEFVTPLKNKHLIDKENNNRVKIAMAQFAVEKPELNKEELREYTMNLVPLIEYEEKFEHFWYAKFLSPYGHLLHEMETPYEHKSHPFSMLLYPLVDGEVWGFVEDIIDQQRYINRLIILMDFMIGSSAKGVLLVPEEAIPDDMNINDFAETWTKFNGVIKIKTRGGVKLPEQVTAAAHSVGISELLKIQERFLSEESGVSGSIQGQDGRQKSGTLYAQETQNSVLNSKDYFDSFNNWRKNRNWKVLKTQIQFYPEERDLPLPGSNLNDEALTYKREKVKDLQYKMTMGRSPDSPIYRGVIEENLKEFLGAGFITFETYLKNTTLPFADNLLLFELQKDKEQAMSGQVVGQGAMGEIGNMLEKKGAVSDKANPKTMALADKFLSGK